MNKLLLICGPVDADLRIIARLLAINKHFRYKRLQPISELVHVTSYLFKEIASAITLYYEEESQPILNYVNRNGIGYAIGTDEIMAVLNNGQNLVLEWPLECIHYVKEHLPVYSILLLPESRTGMLRRLREEEGMPEEAVQAIGKRYLEASNRRNVVDRVITYNGNAVLQAAQAIEKALLN